MPMRDETSPSERTSTYGPSLGLGQGVGYRRGPIKNFTKDPIVFKTQKELLQEQKELLESRLDVISKQLESYKGQ